MPKSSISSAWSSGNLIFFEKVGVNPGTTYNVFHLKTDSVQVGDTANDIDFKYYGTGSRSFIIDCGDGTITSSMPILPTTSDGAALGSGSLMWSDLFLASGAVINFNNGDVTITHASNLLTFAGGFIRFGVDGDGEIVRFYADTADYNTAWSPSADGNHGTWYIGDASHGIDVYHYGGGASLQWDASAGSLVFVGDTNSIDMSTSASGSYKILLKANVADALSILDSSGDMMSITTTTTGREINFNQRLNLIGAGIDMDTAVSGSYNIRLLASAADALSITYDGTDVLNINTSIPIVNFVSLVRFYGTNPSGRGALFPSDVHCEFGDDSSYIFAESVGSLWIKSSGTGLESIVAQTGAGGHFQMYNCYLNLYNTDSNGTIAGDLWYDTSEHKLKFYNGTGVETITSST